MYTIGIYKWFSSVIGYSIIHKIQKWRKKCLFQSYYWSYYKKYLISIIKICRNYYLRCSDHFKENFRLICVCIPELHRFSYFWFGGRRPYWISCSHAFSTAEIFWGFVFLDSGGSKATFLKNSAFYIFFEVYGIALGVYIFINIIM